MTVFLDPSIALATVAGVASVGVVLGAAERFHQRKDEAVWIDPALAAGLAPAATLRLTPRRLSLLDRRGPTAIIQVARAAAAITSVVAWRWDWPLAASATALWLFATQLHLAARYPQLLDGSDEMTTVVWGTLVIAPITPKAALVFLTAQIVIAYWAAGFSKLASREWRDGSGPASALNTISFGSRLSARLTRRAWTRNLIAWGTITFEILGPLCIALGGPFVVAFAAAATGFHLSVARLMGLHMFAWAFLPAVAAATWAGLTYGVLS